MSSTDNSDSADAQISTNFRLSYLWWDSLGRSDAHKCKIKRWHKALIGNTSVPHSFAFEFEEASEVEN